MNYRPHEGHIDFPEGKTLEDPHLDINFSYEFAKKSMGDQLFLLVHSWIIDYQGNIFSRKSSYLLARTDAIDCLTRHIRNHLVNMGVDDMSCRRLMRDFEVDNGRNISYELLSINFPNHNSKKIDKPTATQ